MTAYAIESVKPVSVFVFVAFPALLGLTPGGLTLQVSKRKQPMALHG